MDTLKAMQAFIAVVDHGSLVKAAEALARPTAVVSRQLASLEAHLGTRLLQRTTRRQALTEAGQEYLQRAQQILADVEEAETAVNHQTLHPEGLLRVSAPLSFGSHVLAGLLPELCERYPKLRLDLFVTDRMVDLLHDGIDVALRSLAEVDNNMVARKICEVPLVLCAAPGYLRRHGRPQHPRELADHLTLGYTHLSDAWELYDAAGNLTRAHIHPTVRTTAADVLRALAVAERGIMAVPQYVVADLLASGALVRVLDTWHFGPYPLFAVFPSRKFVSAKVRVFIAHLLEHLGEADPHRLMVRAS